MHEELLVEALAPFPSLLVAFHFPQSLLPPPPLQVHDLTLDLLLSLQGAREFLPSHDFSALDLFFPLECPLNFLKLRIFVSFIAGRKEGLTFI